MTSTTLPISKHNNHNRNSDMDLFPNTPKAHFKFLYIGSDPELLGHLAERFQLGITTQTIKEAQMYFMEYHLYNSKMPDAIFIDLPLNKKEITDFSSFLKSEFVFLAIPVIYHDRHLNTEQKNYLKQAQLIDDAFDFKSEKIQYASKILFIKKFKRKEEKRGGKVERIKKYALRKTISLTFKRTIDIAVSSVALLILSPVIILVGVAIRLESKGPVVYSSKRAGKGFKIFEFYKFRSMVVNADELREKLRHMNQYDTNRNGANFFKIANDPRITKVGKFLRNTSLDELPQLFNVLKGDMSLVGNRPLPIDEAESLVTNDSVERFYAPAGITGLWQVEKRGKAEMSTEERIGLDIHYSRNHTATYDLKIMAKTPIALFQKSDA